MVVCGNKNNNIEQNQHKHEYGCHKYDKHANLTTTILKHTHIYIHALIPHFLREKYSHAYVQIRGYQTVTHGTNNTV